MASTRVHLIVAIALGISFAPARAADPGATQFTNTLASRYGDGTPARELPRQNIGFSADRNLAYFLAVERLDLAPGGPTLADSDLFAYDRALQRVRRIALAEPPGTFVRQRTCLAPRSNYAIIERYQAYDPADPGGFRAEAWLADIATGQLEPLPTQSELGAFRYGGFCFANARDGSAFTFIGQIPLADGTTGATFVAVLDTTRRPLVVRACGDARPYRDANNQITARSIPVQYLRESRQVVLRGTITAPEDRSIRLSVLDCASSNLNRQPVTPSPTAEIPGLVGDDLRYEQLSNDGITASILGVRGSSYVSYVVDRVAQRVLVAPEDIAPASVPSSLSEDGRFLVASRDRGGSRFDVAVVDIGSRRSAAFLLSPALQPFDSFVGDSFQFSEDGSLISFRGGGADFAPGQGGSGQQVYVSSNPFFGDALPQGIVGTAGPALAGVVSDDGRFIAFDSAAAGLDPAVADANGIGDVFVLDRDNGQIKLVSTAAGNPGQARGGQKPALSGDGTRVAFASVTPGSGKLDILVRNLGTSAVTQLSNLLGGNAATADLSAPSLSGDGNKLAFVASGASLLAADGDTVADVYQIDLRTRELVLASAGAAAACRTPKLARSGDAVAFECGGTPVPSQAASKAAPLPGALVLLYDVAARKFETISKPPGSGSANGGSQILGVSGDGTRVLFGSDASNLVSGDTNGVTDLYLGERGSTLSVRRVASQSTGAAPNAPIDSGAISPDGSSIAFTTRSSGIDPLAPAAGASALYLASVNGGPARKVRRGVGGGLSGDVGSPALTFDGSEVVFGASASGTGGPQSKAGIGALNVANNPVVGTDARTLNSAASGFWFNPAQDLQGFLVESAVINRVPSVIVSWYVYQGGRPAWLIGSAPVTAGSTRIPLIITSGADFSPNYNPAARRADPWGSVVLKFSSPTRAVVAWSPTYPGFTSGVTTLQKLAGAAVPGNDRAGEIPACVSGTWYDPAQDGQGLQIQKIDGNPASLVAIWYSYSQSRQFWLLGQGAINGQGATLTMRAYTGAQFPPDFRTADVAGSAWGTLQFSRTGNGTARIQWTPTAAGFSAGSMDLVRISTLTGRPCD